MQSDDGSGPLPRVPVWVWILDGLILLLAAVLSWKLVSDNTRAGVFGWIPYVRSPFLIYGIIALLGVRHIAFPRPTALARLRTGWRSISNAPIWGPAVRSFLGTRIPVFIVAFFAVVTFGVQKPGFVLSSEPLMNLPARFDAGWYGGIALHGYDRSPVDLDRQRNIAFFPAMPALMRAIGPLFGTSARGVPVDRRMVRMLWTGVFVSLCAFLLALFYLIRLGTQLFGADAAASAALLLAAYPFACFFNAPYTEGLFLLGSVATAYHFGRGEWISAGAWGLAAGLTRPNGFILSVPLALLALNRLRERKAHPDSRPVTETVKALAAAAMPVVGMLAFTAYLYAITGVWFIWMRSHGAWGRSYTGLDPMSRGFGWLRDEGIIQVSTNIPFDVLNTSAAVFAVLMIWPVARRIGAVWAIYVLLILVPPMFAGGALSLGRQTSTLFPIFLALAAILPARSVPTWAAAFAILQGLCAALFFTWREMF